MPTYTHIFGNNNSNYGCLNTTTCGVQRIAIKRNRKRFGFRLGLQLPNDCSDGLP
jgi:hypothetical protein